MDIEMWRKLPAVEESSHKCTSLESCKPREIFCGVKCVSTFHTLGLCGKNPKATRCVLGGKSQVKVATLFLTPSFRPTPNEAKGGRPY